MYVTPSFGSPVISQHILLTLLNSAKYNINSTFLPTLNSKVRVKKKTDLALAFSSQHPDVLAFYRKLSLEGSGVASSQMTNTYMKRLAIFCGVEFK